MAAIDGLLKMGLQHAVDEVRLKTDESPQMFSRGGKIRLSIPPTNEATLRHLLDGVLTSEVEAELRASGHSHTSYTTKDGQAFSVAFEASIGAGSPFVFEVVLRRGQASPRPQPMKPPPSANDLRPVANDLRPVANDLRPVANDLRPVANDLRPVANDFGRPLASLLRQVAGLGASDVHLLSGEPATIRVDGTLRLLDATPIDSVEALFADVLDARDQDLLATHSLDRALDMPETGRFRLHFYRVSGRLAAAVRILPARTPSLAELNLPVSIHDLAQIRDGLVLVCGPTGAGKSATLAALAEEAVRQRLGLLVTLEDPVEYRIASAGPNTLVRQRQVGVDVRDFPTGLRDALREDPDIILIGEMRDPETISLALTAAETGHLVLASLHSRSTAASVERIIDSYPPERQQQIRGQLSESLRAVVAQRLLRRARGPGRIPALELLRGNHTVASLIREGKTAQIATALQSSRKDGMLPLERCLADLVRAGQITVADATAAANSPTSLASYLA